MVGIMLCGASDTKSVRKQFARVTHELGGEPWHYLSGNIWFLNKGTSSWALNSENTVKDAHLCVFVILEKYGEVTWDVEFRHALSAGIPFVILCLGETYNAYWALRRHVGDFNEAIKDPADLNLFQMLSELHSETRQLTISTFDEIDSFAEVYRAAAANYLARGLEVLKAQAQREYTAALIRRVDDRLTRADLVEVEKLAMDEFAEKGPRKIAIERLAANGGTSTETILALLGSWEQGIRRLTVEKLADLYADRPPDPAFLDECVNYVNDSDDTGLVRRFIPSLFALDVPAAIRAAMHIDLSEIGTRRRLSGLLVEHEEVCRSEELREISVELLSRCLLKAEQPDWRRRTEECRDRLRGSD